jgi:transcription elongation factor Elf1
LKDVKLSGIGKRIKGLHGPITYLALAAVAGLRYSWCFRNPYYWFAVAFCVKWYRARYVFKIPVWDRQPNWNNIITSKEQEKDLKAFTCKTCGSTLFIAKTREFFFEGNTGIGGLGCFSCGAKGIENFEMDRDRIVEDVAEIDDYFEYERPLDFVSAAERRKLLKEAGGDEEAANQKLVGTPVEESSVNGDIKEAPDDIVDAVVVESASGEAVETPEVKSEGAEAPEVVGEPSEEPEEVKASVSNPQVEVEKPVPSASKVPKKKSKKSAKKISSSSKPAPEASSDDLDSLGMDEF